MSDVYFISARSTRNSLIDRLGIMLDRAGLDFISPGALAAVKMHFGEKGTTKFLSPVFVGKVVEKIKEKKGKPFLTDTSTLYRGMRSNGVDYMVQAALHGFNYATVNAPVIIADGIKSKDIVDVPLDNLKHFKSVQIASNAYYADSLIALSHFKGHLATGFGGAIKNLSMGLGSRAMKQRMHAEVKPEFKNVKLCISCGRCVSVCPADAVRMKDEHPEFIFEECIGCAECITNCPTGALRILWNETSDNLQEKMAETALAVVNNKRNKALYVNFVLDVTPDCDCMPWSDVPIVPDVGIAASVDPVALDKACVDMVNKQPGMKDSALKNNFKPGQDKFRGLYKKVDWSVQLTYGEKIGLGQTRYNLIELSD